MSKEISVSIVNPMHEQDAEDNMRRDQKNGLRVKPLLLILLAVVGAAVGFGVGVLVPINVRDETEKGSELGNNNGGADGGNDGGTNGGSGGTEDGGEEYAGTGFQVVETAALSFVEAAEAVGYIYCTSDAGRRRAYAGPSEPKQSWKESFLLSKQRLAETSEDETPNVVPTCSDLMALEALNSTDWSPIQVLVRDLLVEFAFSAIKWSENPYSAYIPVHVMSGPHMNYNYYLSQSSLDDVAGYIANIERARTVFRYTKDDLIWGLESGYKAYKTTVPGALESISKLADVASAEDLAFTKPLIDHLRALGAPAQAQLDEVLVLAGELLQAIQDLRDYIAETYIPAIQDAPVSIGERVPAAFKNVYHDHLIREFTNSKTLSADDIHQLGLREVARIRSRMEALAQEETGSTDINAFYASFATSEDNQFNNVEDVIAHCHEVMLRVTPKLHQFFVNIPTKPMRVVPVPNSTAQPGTTASYGGDGNVFMNANYYFLLERHLQAGIMVHEGYAGHHFHFSTCLETNYTHPLLQHFYGRGRLSYGHTSFFEGWGLYTERLGEEMDVYVDNRELFGRLQSEMLRACRLVVDTGLHTKGWTRQQAVDFMNENFAALPEEVEFEVDRYISMPGQALAYKMGELSILQTRQALEAKFGSSFDLRKFHSRLLGQCSMPVSTIERFFRDWDPSSTN